MTMTIAPGQHLTLLADRLTGVVASGDDDALADLADFAPVSTRDRFATLLTIYDLHTAPLESIGAAARFQHHPSVAALKQRCEAQWLAELEGQELPPEVDANDPIAAMRSLAARDRLPDIYKWLAREASWEQVVTFLTLEGGPDAGFDDLVAACQIGLHGAAKMELAVNYWDEMGDGDPDAVHTTLHDQLVAAIDMPHIPDCDQPLSALARRAFGGLLATNRWLQPEMLGALGLIELQAGPRCRLVLQALERCNAPQAAIPFYAVHAEVDPRHGKDWLDKAIASVIDDNPEWGPRIVRGAAWRAAVNSAFLGDVAATLMPAPAPRDASASQAA
jgi:hypothetical protein